MHVYHARVMFLPIFFSIWTHTRCRHEGMLECPKWYVDICIYAKDAPINTGMYVYICTFTRACMSIMRIYMYTHEQTQVSNECLTHQHHTPS